METIRKIRCAYQRDGNSIRQIAPEMPLSRNPLKKGRRGQQTEFTYARTPQPLPKRGPYPESLLARLAQDADLPRRQQRTALLLFEQLQREGFDGGYDRVRRYGHKCRQPTQGQPVAAFIPLGFAPGEASPFDWSHELVTLGGVAVKVQVAHFRLCDSPMAFCCDSPMACCIASRRESRELLLDAPVHAFAFLGGGRAEAFTLTSRRWGPRGLWARIAPSPVASSSWPAPLCGSLSPARRPPAGSKGRWNIRSHCCASACWYRALRVRTWPSGMPS